MTCPPAGVIQSSSRAGFRRQRGRLRLAWLLWLLALLPFLLALWQWQRGQQRQAQLAHHEFNLRQAPQPLAALAASTAPAGQRAWLQVRGSEPEIRVANALLGGASGIRIWQPVQLPDGSWVVVDRGWLRGPAAYVRIPLPPLRLQGYWLPRPQPYLLSGARVADRGEVDALDWAALARRLPGRLHDGLLVLDVTLPPLAPWPVRPPFDPQRHYAYALQWLLLGLCLITGAWIVQRRGRDERSGSRTD
ncbi:SURF1 family cytochrome oxidase biogenesis protein [Vogesella alkaliphila]|uniref:SURF1 family cytochrome oxidase biogenesis protein n=1 Tax=Vogesella alkaliphila TaxID=1193621 RepID=UPI001675175B|nr:SURF1 family cytochrome oxidase biogenesis protein [Vogesella alkaliphila]